MTTITTTSTTTSTTQADDTLDLSYAVQTYIDIRERRLALQREAADLSKQEKAIEGELLECVDAIGPFIEGGYRFGKRVSRKPVSWKQVVVQTSGEEFARELAAAQPEVEKLSVERIG